ncbi:MAG: DUF4175 family protein [Myxococcota bacterium]|nr:DUF4175 family protein [Myxococcota bacterium]
MVTLAESLSRAVWRLRLRLLSVDLLVAACLGLCLGLMLFIGALMLPDLVAGRRLLFGLLLFSCLALPLFFFAWLPWFRRGQSSSFVSLLQNKGLLQDDQAAALQLALGHRSSGSDAAVALAIESVAQALDGVDIEPLNFFPIALRRLVPLCLVICLLGGVWLANDRGTALAQAWGTSSVAAEVQRSMARFSELEVTLLYPAYLGRDDDRLSGSDGELELPQGTRVQLRAQNNLEQTPQAAALLIDGLRVAMDIDEAGWVSGEFLARRSGVYRLALTVEDEEIVEKSGHRLTVIPDKPPRVVRSFPEEPLELDAAVVVEFLIEASDDHGIASGQIIYRMDGSEEEKSKPLVLARTSTEMRHRGSLDLEALGLRPGDTLNWLVEMSDNNDVTGPGKGRSLWHRIHLFDPGKRLDGLLKELDRYVSALVDRLAPLLTLSEKPDPWSLATLKALAKGAKLAEKLADSRLDSAALQRAVERVTKRLVKQVKAYQKGLASAAQSEDRMERDLLFLDDLLSKRRLEQLAMMHQTLRAERTALQRLVESYRDASDDAGLQEQILASIRSIRRRLEALGRKMASMQKVVGEQYINKDAMQKKSVQNQLDKLEAMVREGRVDEAMAALDAMTEALSEVQRQVEGAAERFGGKEWQQALAKGKQVKEQLKFITDRQKRLRQRVQQVRRQAHKRHLSKFGSLDELRKKLQRLLAEGRGELAQMTHLEDWLKSQVKGIAAMLERADKALAADGFSETLHGLRPAQGRLESLGWLLNEPGLKRRAAKKHQARAMERVDSAIDLLERLLPGEHELMNRREKAGLRGGEKEQQALSQRLGKLGKLMKELNSMSPAFGEEAMEALAKAKGSSGQASGALGSADGAGADGAQGQVLSALESLKKQMGKAGSGGSGGMPMPWGQGRKGPPKKQGSSGRRDQRVKIPQAEEGASELWRDEIIEAWNEGFAGPGKTAVDRYYRELVR